MQKQIIYQTIEKFLDQRRHEKAGERQWKDVSVRAIADNNGDIKGYDLLHSMTDEKYASITILNQQEVLVSPSAQAKDGWEEKALYQKLALAIGYFVYRNAVAEQFKVSIETSNSILQLGELQSAKIKSFRGFLDEFNGSNF